MALHHGVNVVDSIQTYIKAEPGKPSNMEIFPLVSLCVSPTITSPHAIWALKCWSTSSSFFDILCTIYLQKIAAHGCFLHKKILHFIGHIYHFIRISPFCMQYGLSDARVKVHHFMVDTVCHNHLQNSNLCMEGNIL